MLLRVNLLLLLLLLEQVIGLSFWKNYLPVRLTKTIDKGRRLVIQLHIVAGTFSCVASDVVEEIFSQFEKPDFLVVCNNEAHARLLARSIEPLDACDVRWYVVCSDVVKFVVKCNKFC